MIEDRYKLLICAAASLVGHFVFAKGLELLPPQVTRVPARKIEIQVIMPPAAPEPEPPPEPEPIKPPEPLPEPTRVLEKPRPIKVSSTVRAEVSKDAPPSEHAVVTDNTTVTPTFGVTMESTSQAGGPAMPVGNTTRAQPTDKRLAPTDVKPLAAPVAAVEVTKMPTPQGRCSGKYTEAARAAAIEGVVVVDLIVDETGRARDLKVVEGLGGGLTEAAIAALMGCRFTPGEKDGKPVSVRVRGFKIRFLLQDGQ